MQESWERSPIATDPVSLVLLALQEEDAQAETLSSWSSFLLTLDRPFEILVAGDGRVGPDKRRLETLAAPFPHARVLRTETRHGPGAALRLGLAAARFPLFCYSELSDHYQPVDLRLLLEAIDQVDLVCGRRQWPRGRRRQRLREMGYGWLLRWIFGMRLKDSSCAFKLFRKEIFRRIPIQSDGCFAHAEILAKANFLGCLMTDVPITYRLLPAATIPEASTSFGQIMAEAYMVFSHPDFGPAAVDPIAV